MSPALSAPGHTMAWVIHTQNGGLLSAPNMLQGGTDVTERSVIHGMAVRSGVLSGATAVPEPSTYALLCISLGVVGYARKKMGKQC